MGQDEFDGVDQSIVQRVLTTLTVRPAGLVTDIDGTISRITAPPEAAVVDPAAREALRNLAVRLDLLAVVSGRAVEDARRLVDLDGLVYVGNHGFERRIDDVVYLAGGVEAYVSPIATLLHTAGPAIGIPGVAVENKGVSGSIHYREADDPEAAREAILQTVRPLADQAGLRLSEGRMVVEVRPPIDVNKGTALRDLARDFELRSLVFIGDDVTDLDAMRALRDLRIQGAIDGLAVAVASDETPRAVMEAADVSVPGVDGVIALLRALGERLPPR